jgi:RHH-type rel operon transcriptional repressor/antitoxin RelB
MSSTFSIPTDLKIGIGCDTCITRMSTVTLSLRLPKELAKKLGVLAETLERSKTYILRKALESYLSEQQDYQIALDRLLDKNDPVLSAAELRERFGKDR